MSTSRINKVKERSGWMAYMFSDIKEINDGAKTYSLVRPAADSVGEHIGYAKAVLTGESQVVNWANPTERNAFLEERQIVARVPPNPSGPILLG